MASCKECSDRIQYDIDLIAAFAERTVKRLWITVIVLVTLLVATNGAWLYYESQFEEVSTNTTQEVVQKASNGSNSFTGGDSYGVSENNDNNQN